MFPSFVAGLGLMKPINNALCRSRYRLVLFCQQFGQDGKITNRILSVGSGIMIGDKDRRVF